MVLPGAVGWTDPKKRAENVGFEPSPESRGREGQPLSGQRSTVGCVGERETPVRSLEV